MPWLGTHAREPVLNGGKIGQLEATFFRYVGVCIKRHVGDGEAFGNEKIAIRQMLLHHL